MSENKAQQYGSEIMTFKPGTVLSPGQTAECKTHIAPHPTYVTLGNLSTAEAAVVSIKVGGWNERIDLDKGETKLLERYWGGVLAYVTNSSSGEASVRVLTT